MLFLYAVFCYRKTTAFVTVVSLRRALVVITHNLYGALGYIGGFILAYVVMWCSIYFSIKAKIKKMNKHIQEMHQEDVQD